MMPRCAARFALLAGLCAGGLPEARPQDAAPPPAHALAPLGPLGYWKGDDGASPGAAADSSGNGRAGSYSMGATGSETVPPTKFSNSGSINLDGKTGVVTVPDSPALRIAGDLTIAFWKRRTAKTDDWVRLVGKGNGAQRNYGIWEFPSGDGRIKFQIYNVNGQSVLDVDSPPESATKQDTWYHIACTLSVNAAALHINGVQVATSRRTGDPGLSGDPLTFGHAGYHGFFAGQLDDIRIYDRALSMGEIVYLAEGNGPPAAPTALATSAAGAKKVALQWTAPATPPPAGTITHYIVKRSTASGTGYAAIDSGVAATSATDRTAEAGKTYFYVVTAVTAGGESAPSNELKVVLPNP
jgi:hypothetical protein